MHSAASPNLASLLNTAGSQHPGKSAFRHRQHRIASLAPASKDRGNGIAHTMAKNGRSILDTDSAKAAEQVRCERPRHASDTARHAQGILAGCGMLNMSRKQAWRCRPHHMDANWAPSALPFHLWKIETPNCCSSQGAVHRNLMLPSGAGKRVEVAKAKAAVMAEDSRKLSGARKLDILPGSIFAMQGCQRTTCTRLRRRHKWSTSDEVRKSRRAHAAYLNCVLEARCGAQRQHGGCTAATAAESRPAWPGLAWPDAPMRI